MRIIGIAVIVVFLLGGIGALINMSDDPNDCSSRDAKFYALALIQEQVKKSLSSPTSADFPTYEPRDTSVYGVYLVSSYVDTVNLLGRPTRLYFSGKVRCIPTHDSRRWKVESFGFR